jgi:TRAP transporter 4TM/12TM fusion protein
MGSLSGSAVANTATTGTFTIPMMRSSGFRAETAAGVEAAASSGGALVPPVMGAGAYMMLEIVDPPVTYLEVIRAALLPAILYYLSLWLIVHFHARRLGVAPSDDDVPAASVRRYEGAIFAVAFAALLGTLLLGYTAFRAVSVALLLAAVSALFTRRTRLTLRSIVEICVKACRDSVPLVTAAASVGIVLGVVTLTGVGSRFPALLLPLAEQSLLLALALIMVSSLVLGMGLPSAVCYLLLATLIGPILGDLGVVPLAAHLFIFYFGMMSMVTPPVALAAYTAASLAGTDIMKTSFTAFRFALVGFTLPYMFVFRPQLLMLDPQGGAAAPLDIAIVVIVAALGILAFAAAIAGYLFAPLLWWERFALFVAAGLILYPGTGITLAGGMLPLLDLAGFALLGGVALVNRRARRQVAPAR